MPFEGSGLFSLYFGAVHKDSLYNSTLFRVCNGESMNITYKAKEQPIVRFPEDLRRFSSIRSFSTPHFVFAKYIQTQSGIKQQVYVDMHCLVIVLCGAKIMHTSNGDFMIREGEGLFLQSGSYCLSNITHLDAKNHSTYEALLLFFDNASLLEFVLKHKERLNLNTKIQKPSVFALQDSMILSTITRSFRLYLEEFREELLPFVAHKFEELFLYLSYKYPSIFASFVREIMQNLAIDSDLAFLYCEKEFLNVAQMADLAKTDQATFSRKFKQVFGLSPKIWLDERRFEKARFLLEYSNKNINEICAECGFNSPSWFIERFKSRYHCTPKRYQKSKNLHY